MQGKFERRAKLQRLRTGNPQSRALLRCRRYQRLLGRIVRDHDLVAVDLLEEPRALGEEDGLDVLEATVVLHLQEHKAPVVLETLAGELGRRDGPWTQGLDGVDVYLEISSLRACLKFSRPGWTHSGDFHCNAGQPGAFSTFSSPRGA